MENLLSPSLMRDRIRDCIEKRVEGLHKGFRQNVALLGPPRMGKTSLVGCILSSLHGRKTAIPIWVRADAISFDDFVQNWIGGLLSGLFLSQDVCPPPSLHSLMQASEPLIPRTVEAIRRFRRNLAQEKASNSLRELFSLPRQLSEETGKNIVLVIDEFQGLENLPAADPFGLLGKEIMVNKNTLFLVTSSMPGRAREIFQHKLSLLFGNFELIEMMPFTFQETMHFLRLRLPKRRFSKSQIKFLIHMTNGHPFYLDLILDRLEQFLSVNFDSEISQELFLRTFHAELFDSHGRLAQEFEKRLGVCGRVKKDRGVCILTLLAVAEGKRKIQAIANSLEMKSAEVAGTLQKLLQEGLIVKRGSFYVLEDPLFAFWLRHVYQTRNQFFYPSVCKLQDVLWQRLVEVYGQLEACDQQSIMSRIEILFKEFRNDTVEVNGKKFYCPYFSDIHLKSLRGNASFLRARNARVRWLCRIAEDHLTEEEMTIFLDEFKRIRKNVQRCVLVTLAGIDQNAKLMAQTAKIQLWDLRNLNVLLGLYGLPKIILLPQTVGDRNATTVGALAQGLPQA